jgi:hypothetical protein
MLKSILGAFGVDSLSALGGRVASRATSLSSMASQSGFRAVAKTHLAPRMFTGAAVGSAIGGNANAAQYLLFGDRDGRRSFGGYAGATFRGALGGAAMGSIGGLAYGAIRPTGGLRNAIANRLEGAAAGRTFEKMTAERASRGIIRTAAVPRARPMGPGMPFTRQGSRVTPAVSPTWGGGPMMTGGGPARLFGAGGNMINLPFRKA